MSAQDGKGIRHTGSREEVEARIKHGTISGYSSHRYYKIPPCDACKQANKEYSEKFRELNPGYMQRKWKEFKEKNPNYKQEYHKNNPEQSRQDARRRRARERNVESGEYTEQQVLDMYGINCHLCSEPVDLQAPRLQGRGEGWERGLHLDHIVPISRGGSNTIENIRPAHVLCNLQKGIRWENTQENEG